MTITSRLREATKAQGMTLTDLSRRSGVSYSVVYSCARGAVPGPSVREKLAKALQIAPAELWGSDGSLV